MSQLSSHVIVMTLPCLITLPYRSYAIQKLSIIICNTENASTSYRHGIGKVGKYKYVPISYPMRTANGLKIFLGGSAACTKNIP